MSARLPLLSFAFRPFFLSAGLFASLAMIIWLSVMLGGIVLPIAISPRDWHGHEMIYGYATAAVAGFLFTAIANWTGRPPVSGLPLLMLLCAWLAGRLAMATSQVIGQPLAAVIDVLFLPLVAVLVAREIVAAGNRRNVKVVLVVGLLAAGNAVFHVETANGGIADYGPRLGLAALIGLIILIGGRIVPSFTRNALMRTRPGRLPQPFGHVDIVAVATSIAGLVAWAIEPQAGFTGAAALLAGALQSVRLARWAGDRALGDPLVLVLHVAYAFVPLGFLLIGAAAFVPGAVSPGAVVHAWGVGAVGLMTVAVMTRATIGHTGRPLAASPGTTVVYGLVAVTALTRLAATFPLPFDQRLLEVAGVAWIAAFTGFVAIYGPMMARPALPAQPVGR